MLKGVNISSGYDKKQVLFDVSFEIDQGEIVLLAGSNGSGKSTLLKTIYGILPLWNNGQIIFDGKNITGEPTSELLKKGLLYIPQKFNLFEVMTVKENLQMAGLILDAKTFEKQMSKVLSDFNILNLLLNRTPMNLSGGERQILTLAMASLHNPRMILLDEPFNGLSPQNITLVIENLKLLNQRNGVTLLVIEHRIRECLQIANKIIGLKLGKIFSESDINNTFNINQLNSIFF
ncbi:MAG TPA: ATP-binding cassette domain-containing protein [Cytophagaceae bacterium]|jgi:branched-chain amino acid transport system ATP-binding protein|nr:ATP-binding cassette domain-containing protein [Cytophagaceae bacterium]